MNNVEIVDDVVVGPYTLFICRACVKNKGINIAAF